ncbi:site-specific integrase [Streptomyces sp. SID13666]|uniref:tyrosine-type recombinase/integrase n=1 Tax=Streptomyces sp. SID13666 TaxID=2706054 RepID=UPI0013BF26B9|nr:site-specific integrase [Streptomyces sp. SID13666]
MSENEKRTRKPNGESTIYFGKDGRWHGRVTVGVKDDGTPDRRHVSRKTKAEIHKAVRELEKKRESGVMPKAGKPWTVKLWLAHWVENIAKPVISVNTYAGYEVAVRVHLTPGLGAHRLDKLEPEHIERFYARMKAQGSKAATVHQSHRTLRAALNEAVRRRHLAVNPARLAKAPKPDGDEEEVEPYSLEEVARLMDAAADRRHPVRWFLALAIGLRQGEALGLKWIDLDLDNGVLRVRRSRLRPKYAHGCEKPCGRKPGYCKQRKPIRPATKETKSRAGKRPIGLPPQLLPMLKLHREQQERSKENARQLWEEGGWVFTDDVGRPVNPRYDWDEWKRLLKAAKVRDGRLHDARHTAATVLLLLGIPDTAVDGIMGWEPGGAMRRRYQHMTAPVLKNIADKLGHALWPTVNLAPEEIAARVKEALDSAPGEASDDGDDNGGGGSVGAN